MNLERNLQDLEYNSLAKCPLDKFINNLISFLNYLTDYTIKIVLIKEHYY
jgi:hypothetical protein